jgi:hypothetical protein
MDSMPDLLKLTDDDCRTTLANHGAWRAGFHRFNNNELLTTDTELNAIAAPAITGLSIPIAASGTPSTL